MEMHQVRCFLAMARTLNVTRSAEESDVTQSSLTRAIQKLEEEFGAPLFRRERSRAQLTDLGRLMLPHLARSFEAAQSASATSRSRCAPRVAGRQPFSDATAAITSSGSARTRKSGSTCAKRTIPPASITKVAGTGRKPLAEP